MLVAGGASAEYVRQRSLRVTPATVAPFLAAPLDGRQPGAAPRRRTRVYDSLGGQPAWFAAAARDAALDTLRRADRDALALDSALADLGALADTAATAADLARLDVGLTDALLRFGDALGRAPRRRVTALYGHNWTPAPPTPPDVAARAGSPGARGHGRPRPALDAWADGLRPQHPGYRRLRAALAREIDLQDRPDLVLDRDLAPGDTGAAVVRLRDRLAIDGHAPVAEAPPTFDAALADAVRAGPARLAASRRPAAWTRRRARPSTSAGPS